MSALACTTSWQIGQLLRNACTDLAARIQSLILENIPEAHTGNIKLVAVNAQRESREAWDTAAYILMQKASGIYLGHASSAHPTRGSLQWPRP